MTSAFLSDVLKAKRGVGMKLIQALSRYLGQSMDVLVNGGSGTARNPDPFASRAEAIRQVEIAISRVREMNPPHAEERGVEWWLLQIRDAEAQAHRDAEHLPTPPASAVRRKR